MSFGLPTETGRPVRIKDEGVTLVNNTASLDLAGAGVSATASGDDVTATIPGTSLSNPVTVAQGGTGATTLTGILIGSGTSVITALALPALKSIRMNSAGTAYEAFTSTGNGDALVADPLSQFAATTSAQLAGIISDETGSGALVFATSPTFVTPILGTPTSGTLTNCTGLPVAGITASTTTALGVGSIELGHATDTTIARSGAGAITVEGIQVILSGAALGTPASGTLTNCTGLPVAGITASTTTALGVGSIELGHATDTTIARSGAGAITVEGVAVLLSGGALGTPSSGTLTNCTGLPVAGITASTVTALGVGSIELGHATDTTLARSSAGNVSIEGNVIYRASGTDVVVADGGTGVSSLTAYAVICGGTTTTGAVQSIAGVGTSGQVLTSNGAGALPTFQAAAGGSTPQHILAIDFSTAAEYDTGNTAGGGVATFSSAVNLLADTSATAGGRVEVRQRSDAVLTGLFARDSNFSVYCYQSTAGTDYQMFVGMGGDNSVGAGAIGARTEKQYGFKSIRAASSTTFSATNGSGTTETATSFAQTLTAFMLLAAVFDAGTDIKFYTDGTLQATHTTNLPTTTTSFARSWVVQLTNANVASQTTWKFFSLSFGLNEF